MDLIYERGAIDRYHHKKKYLVFPWCTTLWNETAAAAAAASSGGGKGIQSEPIALIIDELRKCITRYSSRSSRSATTKDWVGALGTMKLLIRPEGHIAFRALVLWYIAHTPLISTGVGGGITYDPLEKMFGDIFSRLACECDDERRSRGGEIEQRLGGIPLYMALIAQCGSFGCDDAITEFYDTGTIRMPFDVGREMAIQLVGARHDVHYLQRTHKLRPRVSMQRPMWDRTPRDEGPFRGGISVLRFPPDSGGDTLWRCECLRTLALTLAVRSSLTTIIRSCRKLMERLDYRPFQPGSIYWDIIRDSFHLDTLRLLNPPASSAASSSGGGAGGGGDIIFPPCYHMFRRRKEATADWYPKSDERFLLATLIAGAARRSPAGVAMAPVIATNDMTYLIGDSYRLQRREQEKRSVVASFASSVRRLLLRPESSRPRGCVSIQNAFREMCPWSAQSTIANIEAANEFLCATYGADLPHVRSCTQLCGAIKQQRFQRMQQQQQVKKKSRVIEYEVEVRYPSDFMASSSSSTS